MNVQEVHEFLSIVDTVAKIVESDADWELKYDLIFSKDISQQVHALNVRLDCYDPDTTYEEDVMAFYRCIEERAEQLRKLEVYT